MGDIPPPFAACDRKAPYVFVSYAHADKADVYPDIQHLHGSGFRIWYDEGITPSEEWLANIAAAIDGCAMFVVFLSPAAVESDWVNREISYAVKRKKPFLAVHLVETKLPPKLDLAIGIYQHIIKPGMARDLYLGKVKAVLPAGTNAARAKTEQEARLKPEKDARKPRDYHGTALDAGEWAAMMDLERALGGKAIPSVQDVQWNTFGFSAGQGHIVELGLYKQGLTSLPETIGELKSLTYFSLASNKLSSLPETIGQLKSLEKLWLNDNKLSSLPDTIGQLTSLNELYLGSNKLSSFPETIGNLRSLTLLDLGYNKLSSLPWTIGDLKSLTHLQLGDNQLSSLPETIGNLRSLYTLWLKDNKLSSLPESIGNLQKLQNLFLGGNHLSSLPESIGQLTSLQELSLVFNQLTSLPGTIKTWIEDLKKRGCNVVQ